MHNTYCIFSSLFAPHVGGQEQFTEHMGRMLAACGNKVIVVTCRIDADSPAEELIEPGAHDRRSAEDAGLASAGEFRVIRVESHTLLSGRYPIPKRRALAAVLSALEQTGIDQIVVNARFYPLSIAGVRFAHRIGKTPLVIDHGSAHLTLGNPILDTVIIAAEHLQTARIKRTPAAYFGVSRKSCDWLAHFGIKAKGVIPNAIDADAFVASSSRKRFRELLGVPDGHILVAFCGRLCPEKGTERLLEAASRLANRKDIHFAFAGKGPLEKALVASRLPRVHALGLLGSPDVAALLLEADIFCLPSRSEGFCTALLEAAACGDAVAITRVGGTDELIPGPSFGIILEDDRPEKIADAIICLADDAGYRETCASAIAQRVRDNHSWLAAAQALETATETLNRT